MTQRHRRHNNSSTTNSAVSELTGVDEELIGNSGVIHVMDGAGKQGGQDLQISEHSLDKKNHISNRSSRNVQDGSS